MGKMLLGLAAAIAVTAIATPATAGSYGGPFVGYPNANANPPVFSGGGFQVGFGNGGFQGGDHRFDRRRSDGSSGGVWVNGGEWAQYNNRAFAADGYNDWWHDNPNHSQPAWVRNNQNCDRQWFAGNVLRC
jgi:hypothetical protein